MPRANAKNPPPPPARTATRIERVEELMVAGTRTMRLVEIVKAEHAVSERQVLDDVKAVRDRWHAESEVDRPHVRAALLAQAEDLYGRCLAANDRKAAVSALQLKADLHGARVRPMAAVIGPGAKTNDVDAWLSGVLGFGASAAAPEEGKGE